MGNRHLITALPILMKFVNVSLEEFKGNGYTLLLSRISPLSEHLVSAIAEMNPTFEELDVQVLSVILIQCLPIRCGMTMNYLR